MMEDGAAVVADGGWLIAAAPTGLGKTAAALAVALEAARSDEHQKTILFMTGRQSQHAIVVETVRAINERLSPGEQKVRLVDLIGQQGMCIHDISQESPWVFGKLCANLRKEKSCSFWMKDVSEIRPRIYQDPLHVEELSDICRNHSDGQGRPGICPWKVARESASGADIVVCDYNHIFHERVREASLAAMGLNLEELILIVDEAHNLPDRIRRGMERRMTATLIRDALFEVQEYLGEEQKINEKEDDSKTDSISRLILVEGALKRLRQRLPVWFQGLKNQLKSDQDDIAVPAKTFLIEVQNALSSHLGEPLPLRTLVTTLAEVEVEMDKDEEESDTASKRLSEVINICSDLADDPALAVVFDLMGDEGRLTTHLLDPGVVAGPLFEDASGGILMSGTLFPPTMYRDLLRIPTSKMTCCEEYESPFLSDRRPVIVANDVTTRFKDRSEDMTKKIRSHLHALLRETPGHVAVFCPSYSQLKEIIEKGSWPGRRVIIEERAWRKRDIEKAIASLHSARRQRQRVMLAGVFNAKLSEGIDYSGNILDAVACIGLPLAPPSARQKAMESYVADRFGAGNRWRYASAQPAMNSILQAMGRPIRKAEDRALVLLLERRVKSGGFRSCLPTGLTMVDSSDSRITGRHAKRFFQRHPEPAKGM